MTSEFFLDLWAQAKEYRYSDHCISHENGESAMKTTLCQPDFCLKSLKPLKNLGVLLLGVMMASCSPSGTDSGTSVNEADRLVRADKSGATILSGSNTVGEELAPRLIAEFKKTHPAAVFQTEFKGTGYGVAGLIGGLSDIAAASRGFTTNEQELARARNVQCNDYVIGSYSIAVVVNSGNSVANLTRDQVRDIFTGVIRDWDRTSRLGEIGTPALIISGEFDESTSAINRVLQEGIAGSHWVMLKNCSHLSHVEDPQGYMGAVHDFLPQVEA